MIRFMNFAKGVFVRCTAIVLLICLCATAVLYVEGAFEFSFIDRQPPMENVRPTETTAPDKESTGASRPGDDTLVPPDTDDIYTDETDPDGTQGPSETTTSPESGNVTPSDGFKPPIISELVNGGYNVTYDNYTSDMIIGEVLLEDKYNELTTGSKFFRDSVLAKIYSDETFTFGDMQMTVVDRNTVETYMGYILISVNKKVRVFDALGNFILETELALSPAYARDRQDRALFFTSASQSKFYYIDAEAKEIVPAEDYNDEFDNRGLFFDYNPNFGKSDVGTEPTWQVCEFFRYFSMNMSTSWHMNNVSPLIAKELQLMYPKYAAMVARFNIRFAHALVQAKIEIAEEEAARREEESKRAEEESKRAEEESKNAELTKDTTEPISPSDSASDSLQSPPEGDMTSSPTETTSPEASVTSPETTASPAEPVEITVPEETRSPETEGESSDVTSGATSDVTSSPSAETGTQAETQTDINPSTDTSTETLTSPEETTASPEGTEGVNSDGSSSPESTTVPEETTTEPAVTTSKFPSDSTSGPIVIEKKFNVPRYGFINKGVVVKTYSFARTFSFNGGRAAVIDDDGRLTFVGYNYQTAITKYSRFKGTFEGADTSTYYISSYYAPVYNDMSSLGHYYFDHGYVTVRQVNIESMFNKRAAYDETYLIDTSGNRVDPPSGYNFVSCSEGIMIVERDGRYGYYDVAKKTWIADPVYTYIMPFYEGLGILGTDGEIGAIDRNGNVVIPFEFEYLSTMSTGLISAYNAEDGWRVFAKMAKTK